MKFLVQQQPAFVALDGADFRPNAASLILIHGAANDHTVWGGVLTQLRKNTADNHPNFLAVDLPGHGRSFADAKSTIETYADWVINLMDNGAIATATIIGHSMGSLIALDLAQRYPSRVVALGLIGTALPMPVSDAVLQLIQADPVTAPEQITRWNFYVRKNADGSFPPTTSVMQTYRALLAAARPGVLANDLNACACYAAADATIAAITIPTAILASEHDKMTPAASAVSLSKRLPNAKLTMLSGVGHAMMQEAPAVVAEWITTIIDPLRPTAT